ncbi:MAG: hypothetical protein JW717_14175 [Marinilabiliaceae bacterium]|nr:hypothetical protein [Marinilabiliaceae bacterium]
MKKTLLFVFSLILLASLNYSCSKDKDDELSITTLNGSGTWNNPFKLPAGTIKANIEPGVYLYEFPYSTGEEYTIKISGFTQNLDLRVVIGYGTGMGTDLTNSINDGLVNEEVTYTFSQQDLYLYIENLSDNTTEFIISIVKK